MVCWFLYCPLNAPCGLSKTHSLPCHLPGEKHSEFRVVHGTKTVSPAQSPMSATISSQTGLRLLVITGLQATFLYLMLLQTSAYGSFFQELFESSELKPDSSSELRRPSVPTALTSWQHLGEQTFLPCLALLHINSCSNGNTESNSEMGCWEDGILQRK